VTRDLHHVGIDRSGYSLEDSAGSVSAPKWGMSKSPDFKRALTRVIEPTGGPGALLETIEDAARFLGRMRPWRQARPHWDYAAELLLKASQTRKKADIEAATAQMERALRRDGWL
jgi:hypothetical protein